MTFPTERPTVAQFAGLARKSEPVSETSPSYELVRSIVGAVRQDTDESGGTIALNGLPLPTTGFFVGGAVPELTYDSFATLDGPAVVRFVTYAPSAYVGWWVDTETGKIHIDAVDWYANEFTASAVGRERQEIAIWDIANEREVRFGSETPLPSTLL